MTVGADIADALRQMRAQAESLMVDACTIGDLGEASFDSTLGVYTAGAITPVYTGPCRVQVTDSLDAQRPDSGEQPITTQRLTVSIPVAALGVKVNHVVKITDASLDPELVDRQYRVQAVHVKTHATARRLQCEEVTARG